MAYWKSRKAVKEAFLPLKDLAKRKEFNNNVGEIRYMVSESNSPTVLSITFRTFQKGQKIIWFVKLP